MSVDDERTRASIMAGFQKFHNSPTCSDIKLRLQVPRTEGIVLHAHKIILAAGSGYFNRKQEEPKAAEWEVDEEDATVMQAAIRYMYGFEFLGEDGYGSLHTIWDFAEVGAIAEKYEISGLHELILTAASHAIDYCVSDAGELKRFLWFGGFSTLPFGENSKDNHFDYAVRIIAYNLTKLRKHPVFQALLNEEHELAVALCNLLAEYQSQVEEGKGKL